MDELDSGVFGYLLDELLGVLQGRAKGQLIFTSHNLRALEKLDSQNIVCSTANPENRFIRMSGIEKIITAVLFIVDGREEFFIDFLKSDVVNGVPSSYPGSWKYIKEQLHYLERHTNLHIYFKDNPYQ